MRARAPRLPGLRFEAQAPPSPVVLPRMDVACFAGFAAGGPFHTPVAIEDASQLTAVFGEDLALAVDPETGELTHAQLGPAVRSFLRGGGRRCWVIRVGEDGADKVEPVRPLAFPVPGLAIRTAGGALAPAVLLARSPGTWADEVQIAASLQSEPAEVTRVDRPDGRLVLGLRFARGAATTAGDLLRITGGEDWALIAPVGRGKDERTELDMGRAVWIEPVAGDDGRLQVAHAVGLLPGALVALDDTGEGQTWMLVDEIRADPDGDDERCVLVGEAWRTSASTPPAAASFGAADVDAERLTLDLWARRGTDRPSRLSELGLVPGHARWVGDLPSDRERYAVPLPAEAAAPQPGSVSVQGAGFPVCGDGLPSDAVLVPLALGLLPTRFVGAPVADDPPLLRNGVPAVEDDGEADHEQLARRIADAFLDPDLERLGSRALAAAADFRRALEPDAPLRGLHAVLHLDEVTLLAMPDAAQRPCITVAAPALPPVTAPTEVPHPDPATFNRCRLRELLAPELEPPELDASGAATLRWTPTDDPSADYLVQGSADPERFTGAQTIYDGPGTSVTVDVHAVGPFVRVRAHSANGDSDWSNGLALDPGERLRGMLAASSDYRTEALQRVQHAALRACGARGDVLAVLSLPAHFREDEALAHVAGLRTTALTAGEVAMLAHGAVYHPWPTVLIEGGPALRRLAPDGAAAGLLAGRARGPGVWHAPAGEPLTDVVALVPPMARGRRLDLQEGRINALVQEPAGFVCLAQETLSFDDDQRPINVRRLLDLLRRLALLHGPRYVFANNDARLARRIQRGFEGILRRLLEAGAFAGATAAESFQVVTAAPRDADAGQLIVELRVAPSLPMRFLTVRLVQGAAGTAEVQEA